jgi:predicted nucleic acid-binding protein
MRSTTVRFADTNVLLYAVSTDPAEAAKASIANALLDERDIVLSAQVLQEFYVQATRPSRADRLNVRHAAQLVESFTRFRIEPTTTQLVVDSIATSERFRISYWDAAVVEAARAAGCPELLSEDLADGEDYAGVRVRNPFR